MLEALVKVLKQVESAFMGLTFDRSDFPFLDLFRVIAVTARDGTLNLFSRLSSMVLSSVIACRVFRACQERLIGKTSFCGISVELLSRVSGRMNAAHPYPKEVNRVSVPPVGL
ncbi:unnamed protein product [Brassica rapa]|uniref:Uncharacterized protein n=1 Tax=Brassica campestris TaxID=3711 RepID=A0A8D9D5V6_BRACM|nr:unnamed protein product [Brassica rapa]